MSKSRKFSSDTAAEKTLVDRNSGGNWVGRGILSYSDQFRNW